MCKRYGLDIIRLEPISLVRLSDSDTTKKKKCACPNVWCTRETWTVYNECI